MERENDQMLRTPPRYGTICAPGRVSELNRRVPFPPGGMAERTKAVVLKTTVGSRPPGVRIPLPPPIIRLCLELNTLGRCQSG